MTRLSAIVVGLFLAIMGALSMPAAGANAFDTASQSAAYVYDCQANYATPTHAGAERAPPPTHDRGTPYVALDRWSHGASARPIDNDTSADTTYGATAQLAQIDNSVGTTGSHVRTINGGLSSFQPWQVAAKTGERSVAIGEDMTNRVEPFAKKIGADTYKADPSAPRETWMENNRSWIRKQMDDGCTIYDCGPAPGRAEYPGPTSPYYKMELDELHNYPNYIRVWLGE